MLQESGVSAIVFYVKDLARTRAFYEGVLGLTIQESGEQNTGAEKHFSMAQAGPVLLLFFEGDAVPGSTPIIVFGVKEGIEDIVDGLVRKGVEIVLPVSKAPGGLTADFLDPDGHVLSMYQRVPRETV